MNHAHVEAGKNIKNVVSIKGGIEMHDSSMKLMERFVNIYLKGWKSGSVLDVGSYDVNGTYKDLFDKRFKYVGLSLVLFGVGLAMNKRG